MLEIFPRRLPMRGNAKFVHSGRGCIYVGSLCNVLSDINKVCIIQHSRLDRPAEDMWYN